MARTNYQAKPLNRCQYCGQPCGRRAKSHTACRVSAEVRNAEQRCGCGVRIGPSSIMCGECSRKITAKIDAYGLGD